MCMYDYRGLRYLRRGYPLVAPICHFKIISAICNPGFYCFVRGIRTLKPLEEHLHGHLAENILYEG